MSDELKIIITADDDASKVVDGVQHKVDKLDRTDATVDVKADDDATKTLDKVDTERRKLDGKDASVEVKAKDEATAKLDDVIERTRKLDQSDATVILKAEAKKAESEVRGLQRLLGQVDGEEAVAVLKAKDEASARIKTVQAELDRINTTQATAKMTGLLGTVKSSISGVVTGITDAVSRGLIVAASAVGFVTDALGKFQETARNARDLAAATGLSTDEASRWIAVADDAGIKAETLQKALGQIVKSLDAQKWADYGVATRDAGGNIRPTNDILLDAFDALGKIPGASARAQAGTELFGKAYAGIAPMIGKTRKEYDAMLKAISDGQVITAAEQRKAENLREAQDELADAFGDVEIVVGQLVADLAPLLRGMAQLAEITAKVTSGLDTMHTGSDRLSPERVDKMLKSMTELQGSTEAAAKRMLEMGVNVEDLAGALGRAGKEVDGVTDSTDAAKQKTEDFSGVVAEMSAQENTAIANLKLHEDAMRNVESASSAAATAEANFVKAMQDEISLAEGAADANIAAEEAQQRFAKAAQESADAQKRNKPGSDAYVNAVNNERDALLGASKAATKAKEEQEKAAGATVTQTEHIDNMNKALLDNARVATPAARRATIDYLITLNQIPADKATEIQALVDQGKIDEAEAMIRDVSKTRTVAINADAHTTDAESAIQELIKTRNMKINAELILKGAPGFDGGRFGIKDGGGLVTEPFGAIVAERRPELINAPTWVPRGTRVTSGADTARLLGATTVNVNLPRGARHGDIATAIQRHTRRSGRRYGAVHYGARR